MKTSLGVALCTMPLSAVGVALAQNGNMMNADDGMWGGGWTSGYGGIAVAILIGIVVAGVVALVMRHVVK